MDDFTLSLCGGFPAQEVIVGGDYSLGGDLSPDISHFIGQEEIERYKQIRDKERCREFG